MANRVLRDWTDSENIDKLSFQAEVLFVRLFMKADDFGCFYANPKLIKAAIFPLKDIRESDISRWMDECQKSGVIAFYESKEKKYLQIINFNQRLRTMRSKFPKPADNCTPLAELLDHRQLSIVRQLLTNDRLKRNRIRNRIRNKNPKQKQKI